MNKTGIVKDLKAIRNSSFVSLNDISKALRVGTDKAKTILEGVDFLDFEGSGRRYFVDDVANAVLEWRKR